MTAGLNATQLAAVVKSTTSDGKPFPSDDEAPAVALGLYFSHQNNIDKTGQFGLGLGSEYHTECGILCAYCLDQKSRGADYFTQKGMAGQGWQLFLPEATAALAVTGAGPENATSTNPIQNSPAQQFINDTSLGDLIGNTNAFLTNIASPLFWRQVWFIGGGWLFIAVGAFQIIRGGVIRPVGEGLRQADNFAYDVANLRDNVYKPFKAYRAQRKATAGARATARGNKLIGLAPGARRYNQKTGAAGPLGGAPYNPNAKPTPPRPKATPGKPPPAKFTGG